MRRLGRWLERRSLEGLARLSERDATLCWRNACLEGPEGERWGYWVGRSLEYLGCAALYVQRAKALR